MTGMVLAHDGRFVYRSGWANGRDGCCWLRLWTGAGRNVAVVSELADNPGPSITNAIEAIYEQVAELAGPDVPLVLVEHYDDVIAYGRKRYGSPRPATFDRVDVHLGRAGWERIAQADVEALIGQPWPELVPS